MKIANPFPTRAVAKPLIGDTETIDRVSKFGNYVVKESRPVKLQSFLAMIDPIPKTTFDIVMKAFVNAGYDVYKVCGPTRKRHILYMRYALIHHLLNSVTPVMTLNQIGEVVGGRDHTTVINARNVMKDLADIGGDGDIVRHIDRIGNEITKILAHDSMRTAIENKITDHPILTRHAV